MLNLHIYNNTWKPPEPFGDIDKTLPSLKGPGGGPFLYINNLESYLDSVYLANDNDGNIVTRRFVFHEGYRWSLEDEAFFVENVVLNPSIQYDSKILDSVFEFYNSIHPEWKIKKRSTQKTIILDHIYNCLVKNTIKELLYKAGLDYLAAYSDAVDEFNLIESTPSSLYEGIPIKVLRALNCEKGTLLLNNHFARLIIRQLNCSSPDIFSEKLTNAQCVYLKKLIYSGFDNNEIVKFFEKQKDYYSNEWSSSYLLNLQIQLEPTKQEIDMICGLDPIFAAYIQDKNSKMSIIHRLKQDLIYDEETITNRIRKSNLRRGDSFEEVFGDYIIRLPHNTKDYYREAIYMRNCLVKKFIEYHYYNVTTILFLRRREKPNEPYITFEVYKNELYQAFHRYDAPCTYNESELITNYCKRHGIKTENWKLGASEQWRKDNSINNEDKLYEEDELQQ